MPQQPPQLIILRTSFLATTDLCNRVNTERTRVDSFIDWSNPPAPTSAQTDHKQRGVPSVPKLGGLTQRTRRFHCTTPG